MAYEADRLKLHKHKAAENIALLATCKAQEINPREYLNDVITKLPYYLEKDSGKNIRELLPDVWKLEKSNTNTMCTLSDAYKLSITFYFT